mmetsp:Transcript_4634/g.6976  ORF Transcript_4634/g.6976 Transcript_4634/m.6976 type:complete len:501 (+) Transcript_4634:137-1639(+)
MSSSKLNVEDEMKDVKRAIRLATPLWLLFIPVILVSLLVELAITVFGRLWPFKGSPDAKGVQGATPIPRKAAFVGDIVGFIKGLMLPQANSKQRPGLALGPNEDTSSRVWVDNHGFPVVSVMDAKSVESMVVDYDCKKHKRVQCPLKFPIEGTMPNFYRSGNRSKQFRELFIDMVPRTEHDEQFKVAMEAAKAAAQRWIAAQKGEPGTKEDFLDTCITAWSTALIIGEEVPPELMAAMQPLFLMFSYPRFYPAFLIPPFWGALKAREHLHKRIKASPRWPKILSKATEVGLTPSDACDALIPIANFNAKGLIDSIGIAVDFLPTMNYGEDLIKDSKALESFAWETLRFNGPVALMPARDEPTIIKTSAGATHAVKKDTMLSTRFDVTQLDPTVWPEPNAFKADRYLKTTSTTTDLNPWPTLTHAMPLGTIENTKKNHESHSCAMGHLNYRVVEAYIKMLATDLPRYDLLRKDLKNFTCDEDSKKEMYSREVAENIVFHSK